MPNSVLIFVLAAASSLITFSWAHAGQGKRPNILWITTEDMSPDLGCYGDSYARSPNIDALAAEGARFSRAFATAPVCSPSRSSIITGMYASTIGTHHHRSEAVPPAYVKCFTESLRAAGYFCTNNVKTDYNFKPPLTAWDENSGKAHWRHRGKGQPFFSVFNFTTTHEGRLVRSGERKRDGVLPVLAEHHDPAKASIPPYYPDTPAIREQWARYHDHITQMDQQVAELLQALEKDGLEENTIVFFFSDHGRGLPRGKRWLYDSGLQVPLIVRWPGKIDGGSVRDDLVSLIDLAPTLLSIAGCEIPSHMQGQVFLGDHVAKPREFIYATRDRMDETTDMMRAVRDQRFKYIRNFHPELPYTQTIKYMEPQATMREMRRLSAAGELTGPPALFFRPTKPPEELYDTAADPHEINNLAGTQEHRKILQRLRTELDDWMKRSNDLGIIPEPELIQRMRPNGKKQVTAAPVIQVDPAGEEPNVRVAISSPTEGASIAYTTGSGDTARWQLYAAPVEVPAGTIIRARGSRAGFADSPEAKAVAAASAAVKG
jgi:uncharacterized sulfatase